MINVAELFGSDVFNDKAMRERLPKAVYRSLRRTIDANEPLDPAIADAVASAMKDWAVEKGATHYTHWFQPMTDITAEKHDSFISPVGDGTVILEFSGKELIQGEPDASSFPSGGLRSTFEARGYTAWDCTSPAFVKDGTLYIPTAFCSYTGEALDKKTPLLRSMDALSRQAMRILNVFGIDDAHKVITTVGPEQEYFLIDKEMFNARKDLIYTGRTLFGAAPPKGQELEDQYFTTFKERVSAFMHELDAELWRLGVTATTKHNEVAPAQHDWPRSSLPPTSPRPKPSCYETMKKVALHHGFACLLHKSPSPASTARQAQQLVHGTDTAIIFWTRDTPHENAQFLVFLSAVIWAVDEYAEILRASTANPGNDHRLGANEAPPAIVSIFLGDQLTQIMEKLSNGDKVATNGKSFLKIGVSTLPSLPKDAPTATNVAFAFTGNKIEFHVGSRASISGPNFLLNSLSPRFSPHRDAEARAISTPPCRR
jgi:glutamine synthetase